MQYTAVVPQTVLIASAEHLAALRDHDDLAGAQAFSDADALKALDAITHSCWDNISQSWSLECRSR